MEDNCAVERKALRDFAASVIAGRLFKQTAALAAGARRGVVPEVPVALMEEVPRDAGGA